MNNIFNDLDDDCVRETFRHLHSLVDFVSVANVCKRFNALAMGIFSFKIQQKTITLGDLMVVNRDDVTLLRLEHFFPCTVHRYTPCRLIWMIYIWKMDQRIQQIWFYKWSTIIAKIFSLLVSILEMPKTKLIWWPRFIQFVRCCCWFYFGLWSLGDINNFVWMGFPIIFALNYISQSPYI